MWVIRRLNPAEIIENGKFISFTGAGGKTSLIEYLSSFFVRLGKRVAITTTTKIYAVPPFILFREGIKQTPFIRVGSALLNGKLTGLSFEEIKSLGSYFDTIFIEADGSRGMPLKFPKEDEPIVPPFSEKIFVVSGLDAIGWPLKERVLRWELFCEKTHLEGERIIDHSVFKTFFQKDILLKNAHRENTTIILNKYDLCQVKKGIVNLAKSISEDSGFETIVSSIPHNLFYMVKKGE